MKKLLLTNILLIVFASAAKAQPYHYPFGYNQSGLNIIDDAFFNELEKDLGRSISFNNISPEYTYIQHLKNKSILFSLQRQMAEFNQKEHADSIYVLLQEIIEKFPTQTGGYYLLARLYLDFGEIDEAIGVLKKAALKFNISPKSFSYLTQLHAENEKFIQGYNELLAYYLTAETTTLPDSNWIALYDSIKKQDQLYRGKYSIDDPRFEPQFLIDEQNALLFRELVREHGWVSKYLGRDYHMVHIPVMHFAIEHQLYLLDYIIADCLSYKARWLEAEQVIWKIINHQSMVIIDNENYHSLPLMYIDSLTGVIDLEQSMLAIRSAVLAMFGCGGNRSDIWLVATSEFPNENYVESLNVLKKYFAILGLDEDKIHIQAEFLDKEIEGQLKLKTPFVLKRQQ